MEYYYEVEKEEISNEEIEEEIDCLTACIELILVVFYCIVDIILGLLKKGKDTLDSCINWDEWVIL